MAVVFPSEAGASVSSGVLARGVSVVVVDLVTSLADDVAANSA